MQISINSICNKINTNFLYVIIIKTLFSSLHFNFFIFLILICLSNNFISIFINWDKKKIKSYI